MPPISKQKKDKISEQMIAYLFSMSPEAKFTAEIARETARDEEFTKFLLQELEKNKLIIRVKKSPLGVEYRRRERWRLSNQTYEIYKKHQPQQSF
ncbi:MAG: hypothetical protein IIA87_00225 [Nanoarchaeota archaeon]|nr:hypothetical protein [Nanoarchaeota archaeon]